MLVLKKMSKTLITVCFIAFSATAFATPVNINTASAEEIAASLKGVGIAKARAIVAHRNSNGPFKTKASLAEVKGIGERTVALNEKDIIVVEDTRQ
ncbi:MAG: helix-hairpin-helix domain-containing protein [Pseudomonadota bacterium]